MFWTAIILFSIMSAIHVIGALGFRIWAGRNRKENSAQLEGPEQVAQPRVAVLVSVRGLDPFFAQSLQGLLHQDYLNYEVHIIVDGDLQPVTDLVGENKNVSVSVCLHSLRDPLQTCGLKCSALNQVISVLPSHIEILAFMDADVVPHAEWLSTLIRPLQDSLVGVVTGGQWFEMPTSPRFDLSTLGGTWVRRLWNAGSIVPTSLMGNPWAGTLAMRRKDFEAANLAAIWSRSAIDDGPIRKAMHQIGLKVVVEPRLLMINRESCSMEFSRKYIGRMLTWSRWFEATFWNTVVHGILMLAGWMAITLAYVKAIGENSLADVGYLTLAVLMGLSGYVLAFLVVRQSVLGVSDHPSAYRRGPMAQEAVLAGLFMPLTHCFFFLGLVTAIFFRHVNWRGIRYSIRSADNVEVQGYRPFVSGEESNSDSL
jgi:hypothetical protein